MDNNDDERNVDAQLDEEQKKLEASRQKPLIENHTNNARVDPPSAGDPRKTAEASSAIGAASEAMAGTTVTESAKGTEGTTVTGEEPEP